MYPKMLYGAKQQFADQKALELAVHDRSLKTLVVQTAKEEATALKNGFTDDLASLVKAE